MPAHQYYQTVDSPVPPAHQKRIGDVSPVCYKGSEPWRSGMGLKTLIVDDEPIARKVLRDFGLQVSEIGTTPSSLGSTAVFRIDHDENFNQTSLCRKVS